MARKHLQAGELRHVVELQRPTRVQDTSLDIVEGWESAGFDYAAIQPFSSRELVAAQAVHHEATMRFVLRYRTDLQPTWRLIWSGQVFSILGSQRDMDSTVEYLTLTCSTGVSDEGV